MKTTLFTNISAIALTGLAFTLATSPLSAHEHSKGGNSLGHGDRHNIGHGDRGHGHGRSCSHLPRGCRPTRYRGERCWFGGGHYYRCNTVGTYEIIDQPEVEVQETVVEQPVVQRRVIETEVEEPAYEEESEEISYLPENCETVYVGGERCWFHNGCYYRHCGHGYKKFHCKGDRGHGSRTCKNDRGHRDSHGTRTSGRGHGSHTSHNSGHSSHNSGHSNGSGHNRK